MLDWLFGKKKVEQRILTNDDAQNAFDFKFFDKSGLAARVYPQAADIVPLHPDAAPIRMKDYDYSTEEGRRKAALDPRIPTLDFVRPNDAEVNKLWELHKYLSHLVTTLSTSDIYNDISICPFSELVLYNSFT